jgi:hypothetical protein
VTPNADYETVRQGAWWWRRQSANRIIVGFGSEFSTYLSQREWKNLVDTVGYEASPIDSLGTEREP